MKNLVSSLMLLAAFTLGCEASNSFNQLDTDAMVSSCATAAALDKDGVTIPVVKKYKRSECPECKGTGMVTHGDGHRTPCGACEPDSKLFGEIGPNCECEECVCCPGCNGGVCDCGPECKCCKDCNCGHKSNISTSPVNESGNIINGVKFYDGVLVIESPDGKSKVEIRAQNGNAGVWIKQGEDKPMVSIYADEKFGAAVGVADSTKSEVLGAALSAKPKQTPHLQMVDKSGNVSYSTGSGTKSAGVINKSGKIVSVTTSQKPMYTYNKKSYRGSRGGCASCR